MAIDTQLTLFVEGAQMATKNSTEGKPNRGGWKTWMRDHKYRGAGSCPIC
jgi:hypothetical protein